MFTMKIDHSCWVWVMAPKGLAGASANVTEPKPQQDIEAVHLSPKHNHTLTGTMVMSEKMYHDWASIIKKMVVLVQVVGKKQINNDNSSRFLGLISSMASHKTVNPFFHSSYFYSYNIAKRFEVRCLGRWLTCSPEGALAWCLVQCQLELVWLTWWNGGRVCHCMPVCRWLSPGSGR